MALVTACQREDNAFPESLVMRWGLPEGERVCSRMPFTFFNYTQLNLGKSSSQNYKP